MYDRSSSRIRRSVYAGTCSVIAVGFGVDKVAMGERLKVSKDPILCGWDAGITLNHWENIPENSPAWTCGMLYRGSEMVGLTLRVRKGLTNAGW